MITLLLAPGRAEPGAKRPTVRVLPIAMVPTGGAQFGEVLGGPVRARTGGPLVEGDEACDVARDDPDRDEVHGALLSGG